MSRVFVESFFPAMAHYLNTNFPAVVDWFLPPDVAVLCPEVVVVVRSVASLALHIDDGSAAAAADDDDDVILLLRNPVLGLWAVGGIGIGFVGCIRLLLLCTNRQRRLVPGQQQQQRDDDDDIMTASLWLWSLAFGWFGVMNLAALPYHCLLFDVNNDTNDNNNDTNDNNNVQLLLLSSPVEAAAMRLAPVERSDHDETIMTAGFLLRKDYYYNQWLLLWMLDTCSTGISSSCLIGAWILWSLSSHLEKSSFERNQHWRCFAYGWMAGTALLLAAALAAVFATKTTTTIYLELWYLIPVLLAGYATVGGVVWHAMHTTRCQQPSNEKDYAGVLRMGGVLHELLSEKSIQLLLAGGVVTVLGVLGDASFCRWTAAATTQVQLYDGLMAGSLVFLGCDLAFGGIYLWIIQQWEDRNKKKKIA